MPRRRSASDTVSSSAIRIALHACALLVLVACGAPMQPDPDPDPDPELAITGIDPAVALPGQQVTIAGSGFAEGQVVAFDGIEVAVVSRTSTSLQVIVPDTYGYPVVGVDDATAERLLFVGTAYGGPATLAGIQASLDAIAEGEALRIPAGTYTGSVLVVDNRQLFGSGAASVLEASADVRVLARSGTVAVVAELGMDVGAVELGRGRLGTASSDTSTAAGAIVIADVDLTAATLTMVEGSHLDVALRDVRATIDALSIGSAGASLSIVGGDLTADAIVLGPLAHLLIDGAGLTAVAGPLLVEVTGSVDVRSGALTSADVTFVEAIGDVAIEDSTFDANNVVLIGANDGRLTIDRTGINATVLLVSGRQALALRDVTATTTSDDISASSALGAVVVTDSSLSPARDLSVAAPQGAIVVRDSDVVTGTGAVTLQSLGPIVVADTSLQVANDIVVSSSDAGDVAIERSQLSSAGMFVYGSNDAYAGANGTVRFQGNTALTVSGTIEIDGRASDVVVAENGPIEANAIVVQSAAAHVTLRDNERIESATNVTVQAAGPGGRLTAIDNLFIADDGAGTITLETQAGELSESGNIFTGTPSFPNNE